MRAQAALLALALLAACRETGGEASLRPRGSPNAAVHVDASLAPPLRFGSPFSADYARVRSLSVAGGSSVRVRFHVLRSRPRLPLAAPLDNRVRVAIDEATGEPLLVAHLAEGGALLDGASARSLPFDASDLAGDEVVALPPGVTVRIALESARPETAPILSAIATPVER